MGYFMCPSGQHIRFISVTPMQAFDCDCKSEPVFVFGSNLAGRHGAGAALFALKNKGAIYGQGSGPQGNSFAIATKDKKLKPLPLEVIRQEVDKFINYADWHPLTDFEVTRVGCGLAGYRDEQIAPMFKGAPGNCKLPKGWREFNGEL